MEQREVMLGDHIHIKHGYPFASEHFVDEGEYLLLSPGNCHEVGGLKLRGDRDKYYDGEFPQEYLLSKGDLLVVMTDLVQSAPLLGGAFVIPEDGRYLHNQRLGLVTVNPDSEIDKSYLYYLLNTHEYRGQVRGSASGSTVRHTSPTKIYRCKVRVPDLDTQRRIASILSSYDDLIENNRWRIKLLERAARLLYKEWFVRLRYPGYEGVKVKDGVPEGWEKKTIDDVAETIGGGTPKTEVREYWEDGDITWFSPRDLTANGDLVILDSENKITERGYESCSAKLLPPESILMTSRATIGVFALCDKPCATNQGFISLIPREDNTRMYILFNLMSRKDELLSNAQGSTFAEISKSTFRALSILMPRRDVLAKFESLVYDMIKQIRVLKKQNAALTRARDLLLPRLMSGKVKV